ncbi:MAG: peptide chain release factor N(5)-glutamine methyltransferase [Mangrovibacterium sp.]
MQQSLTNIRKELESYYSKEEIQGFIQLIFYHLKNYSLADMILNEDKQLSENDIKSLRNIIFKLKKYVPIQYILGQTEFCDLIFHVDSNVLIPRPETEELVRWALNDFQHQKNLNVFDACTGSGCIAISLAKYLHQAKVSACDISDGALHLAQLNAHSNKVNIGFHCIDMLNHQSFTPHAKYDIIISNPPYVLNSEKLEMSKNVLDYEPHLALFVDDDKALIFYEAIADFACLYLNKTGSLYFEINESYAPETLTMLKEKGFSSTELRQDVFKKNRMIKASL